MGRNAQGFVLLRKAGVRHHYLHIGEVNGKNGSLNSGMEFEAFDTKFFNHPARLMRAHFEFVRVDACKGHHHV